MAVESRVLRLIHNAHAAAAELANNAVMGNGLADRCQWSSPGAPNGIACLT